MERWENEQNNSEMMIYTTEDGLTKIETTFDGDTDKKAALETALAQIEKQFGKGAVMKLGANVTMRGK